MSTYHRMMSMVNGGYEPGMVVWTKFHVPEELDTKECIGYFQPLVHAVGHQETLWSRAAENTNTILIVSLWYTAAELGDFTASPSAQLYTENLASKGITPLVLFETIYWPGNWFSSLSGSYLQLHWVYFSVPMTEAHHAQISEIRGMEPPALGISGRQKNPVQKHRNVQLWATRTEDGNGQEVQLMLWLHFWRDAKKAEWRNIVQHTNMNWGSPRTIGEGFIKGLEEARPMEWKEEIYEFKKLPRY
ncbi:hypothetical protein ASPSYDRAFT_86666 [Aspergillus sydowii CBS 593.65]|uniref:ABM domain-containing protein n=1 Tax=Aspergillus sydowii CBS 593.65 TaxID=1036612 RepID=A0A1L9TUJ2_9EURO|nr:uncharacterized protein ASPSYDRAFT_86666 [Aspergillus sydowii CBS 593.65]OJJ63018.1 hypothetical protein ASPSYDRAFT_86666 [Aspergillus sydowii CBS 593.65]